MADDKSKDIRGGDTSNRGFASMDEKKQKEIASQGGQASGGNFANNPGRAAEAGRKGGQASGGNFANDPQRASEAGRKGGEASHSGQAQRGEPNDGTAGQGATDAELHASDEDGMDESDTQATTQGGQIGIKKPGPIGNERQSR